MYFANESRITGKYNDFWGGGGFFTNWIIILELYVCNLIIINDITNYNR